MAERNINATLKKRLINNEPFVYAHLIKYERPSAATAHAKHSTDAVRYAYLTDGPIDIIFDDNSYATDGTTSNGNQLYIADKVLKVGSYQETNQAKATGMTLKLTANSINNSVTGTNFIISPSEKLLDVSGATPAIDLVKEGFRVGDKIYIGSTGSSVSNEANNGKEVRIARIENNSGKPNAAIIYEDIDTLVTQGDGTLTFKIDSDELKGPLLERNEAGSLKSYHNRDVFIYKAFLDPDTYSIIGTPVLVYKGIIASTSIVDNPSSNIEVQWKLTSHWGDFTTVNGRWTNDAVHRALNNEGVPDQALALKEIYAGDLGFMHAEITVNILATYKAIEQEMYLKKKKKWFGLSKKYTAEYRDVEVERQTDLNWALSSKYIPVIYGVDRVAGIPIFVDTLNNNSSKIYMVFALCEGEIGGLFDLYVESNPLICQTEEDADARTSTAESVDVVCRGRADRGTVLAGKIISGPNADTPTTEEDFEVVTQYSPGRNDRIPPRIRKIYARALNQASTSVTSTNSRGVGHEETISMTAPNTMNFDLHVGKTEQRANNTLSEIANGSTKFKRQSDYWDEGEKDYWGPNHTLADTAYVVMECTIAEDAETVPEVEYVVRGKLLECYNYDFSYIHNPLSTYSSESAAHFTVGETIDLKRTDTNAVINNDVYIIDKWTMVGKDGVEETRFRLSDAPEISYIGGVPSITNFYMDDGDSHTWHMLTYNHVFESGTVPNATKASATIGSSSNVPTITFGSGPDWVREGGTNNTFPKFDNHSGYLPIRIIDSGGNYSDTTFPIAITSATVLTMTGATATKLVTGTKDVIRTDTIRLAAATNVADDLYNGMIVELTVKDANNNYTKHTRKIIDYDQTTDLVQVDRPWDSGFEPGLESTSTYTYKIFTDGDKRVSVNPSIQLLDYATSSTYGLRLDLEEHVSLSNWTLAARTCDDKGSQTLTVKANSVDTADGDMYVLTSDGTNSGDIIAMGTVVNNGVSGDTTIEFQDCFNKFSKDFMKSRHSYLVGDIVNNSTGYFRVTSAGVKAKGPTEAGATGYSSVITTAGYPIFKLSQSGGNTVVEATTGKLFALKQDTQGSTTYESAVDYSLYNSDFVKYWRYLGWEDHEQRWATRHQFCGVLDTATTVFENVNSFLRQMNGMLSYENGKYVLRIATTSTDIAEYTMKGLWTASTIYAVNDQIYYGANLYTVTAVTGNATSSSSAPTHTTGDASNGNITLTFVDANSHNTSTYSTGSQTNVRYITNDDIIGTINLTDPGPKKSFNTMTSTISDPGSRFKGKQVSFFDSEYLKTDKNVIKSGSHTQPAVASYFNARINVENALRKSRFGMKVSFKLGPKALLLLAGDTIAITHSKFDWTAKKFRITNVTYNLDCTASISAEEYDDSFYTISTPKLPSVTNDDITESILPTIGAPTALSAVSDTIGTIDLSWTAGSQAINNTDTEVWVHTSNNRDNAKLKATTPALIGFNDGDNDGAGNRQVKWTDTIGYDGRQKYYWIRHTWKNRKGRIKYSGWYPSSSTGGVTATTVLADTYRNVILQSNAQIFTATDGTTQALTITITPTITNLDNNITWTTAGDDSNSIDLHTAASGGTTTTSGRVPVYLRHTSIGDNTSISVTATIVEDSVTYAETVNFPLIATTTATAAKSVRVRSSGLVFLDDNTGTSTTPDSPAYIKLEAVKQNTSATANWAVTEDSPSVSLRSGTGASDSVVTTGDTVYLHKADYAANTNVLVTLTCDSIVDTASIVRLSRNSGIVQAVLSNSNHVLSADNDGAVSNAQAAGSGTTMRVYAGATALNFTTGTPAAGEWALAVADTAGITEVTPVDSGSYATIPDYTGVTTGTDTYTITFTISGKNLDGTSFTNFTTNQYLTKAKAGVAGNPGATGTAAYNVSLSANKYAIAYNIDGAESDTLTFTAAPQGIQGTATYLFAVDGVTKQAASTTATYAMADGDEPASGAAKLVKVTMYDDTVEKATDSVSIYGIQDGQDAVTIIMTNEAHALPTSASGTVTYTNSGTDIRVFRGSTPLAYHASNANTFSIGTPDDTNITVGAASTVSTYTRRFAVASSITAATASITFTIAVRNALGTATSFTKIQTINKTTDGAAGAVGRKVAELIIYKYHTFNNNTTTLGSAPTTGTYNFNTKVVASLPSGWTQTKPAAAAGVLLIQSETLATESSGGTTSDALSWSTPSIEGYPAGDINFIFRRDTATNTPADTAYGAALPSSGGQWYDDIADVPAGSNSIWVSKGVATWNVSSGTYGFTWDWGASSQIEGSDGAAGAVGKRSAEGILYATAAGYSTVPNMTTYTFSNKTFTGGNNAANWTLTPPALAGVTVNTWYQVNYNVTETTSAGGTGTPAFGTPVVRVSGFGDTVVLDEDEIDIDNLVDDSNVRTYAGYAGTGFDSSGRVKTGLYSGGTYVTVAEMKEAKLRTYSGLNTSGELTGALNSTAFPMRAMVTGANAAAVKTTIALQNVDNTSDATTLGGELTGSLNATAFPMKAMVTGANAAAVKSTIALNNVANENRATILGGNLTGTIDSTAVATVKGGAVKANLGLSALGDVSRTVPQGVGGTGLTSNATLLNSAISLSAAGALSGAGGGTITKAGVGITTTFKQDGVPTAVAVGDIWIDTNDGNKTYRAAAAGANEVTSGEWEVVGAGTSKANIGLGNVDNTSDATTLGGELTGSLNATAFPMKAMVTGANAAAVKTTIALQNVDNSSASTIQAGTTKANVGLGSVDNDSTSTIRAGTTKANVGLANVDNTSDATTLGGELTGSLNATAFPMKAMVTGANAAAVKTTIALQNVDNTSDNTVRAGNITGTVNSVAVATVTSGAALGTSSNQDATADIRSGTTATNVGLGNVTNESKATMLTSPAITGTPTGVTKTHVGLSAVDNTSDNTIRAGNITGTVNSVAVATVTSGAASGATANQDSSNTIRAGTITGNLTGTIAGVANATVRSGAASGATANQDSTGTILGGNLTGTVNSVAVATVSSGAAAGATANQSSNATIRGGITLNSSGVLSGGGTSQQVNIGSVAGSSFDTSGDFNASCGINSTLTIGTSSGNKIVCGNITIDGQNARILITD